MPPMVPPAAPTNPSMETYSGGVDMPPSEIAPPPPIMQTPGENQSTPVVAEEKPKGGGGKTVILILAALVILGALAFGVIKFLLPMLGSGGGSNKEVTLTWWGLWESEASVAPLISEYQAKKPNVKINYVVQSKEDYRERLTNALAKGTGPDIFRFHNTWVPMFKNELDTIPAKVVSPADFSKVYYPVTVSDLSLGTGFVGMPLGIDTLALFVNEDIFGSSGKSVPKTWDELRQTALDLTVKDETGGVKQAGAALGRTENVDHWQEILALMMLQNGVRMSNPVGKPAEDALTYFSVFSNVDGVWDETLPPSTVAFAGGKLAMYFGPSWRVFDIKTQNPNLKFKVALVPQLPKDTETQVDVTYATYWAEGVWKRSKNKDAAWDFVNFIASREALQKMYTTVGGQRLFGEPYPRVDMAELVATDPMVSVFLTQAVNAKSWYLASRTFDGPTGINSQIGKYFEDAINAVNAGTKADKALATVAAGVNQVLSTYGLAQPAAQIKAQ